MDNTECESRVAAMDQWYELVRRELANLISENRPKVIYHYTDAPGLIGMISSGHVWATHVSRLNDSTEYELGLSIVTQFVRDNLQESSKPLVEKAISQLQTADTYISCYSGSPNLLSQWRAYSGQGTGYCIGFKTSEMATLDDRMPLLEKVIYSKSTAEAVLSRLLSRLDEYLNEHEFGEVEVGYLMGTLEGTFNNVACIIKHSSFMEENEYRQIYQPGASIHALEIKYRMGRFGLTPYVELEFLEKGKLPIESVMIGPCRDPQSESRSLELILSQSGYEHVQVTNSEIPLRV